MSDWDPTSWNLNAKQIQRRRSVFWELSSFDSWKVSAFDRSCLVPIRILMTISLSDQAGLPFSICTKLTAIIRKILTQKSDWMARRYPDVTVFSRIASAYHHAHLLNPVWAWKHDFGRNIIAAVADRMCTVRPTKYSEILELDRKVREFKITNYRSPIPGNDPQTVIDVPMTLIYREISE